MLVLSSFLTPVSASSGKEKKTEGEDFTILQENNSVIEYITTEDDYNIRVLMEFNIDRTKITSKVYKLTNEDDELIRETSIDIGEESAKVKTITTEGDVTTLTVGQEVLKARKIEKENIEMYGKNYDSLGPWVHNRTIKFRQDIVGMTKDTLAATLIGIYWWPAGAAISLYGLVKAANTNAFWTSEQIAFKHIKGTNLPRGERHIDRVFADKQLKHYLKGPIFTYNYTRGWEP